MAKFEASVKECAEKTEEKHDGAIKTSKTFWSAAFCSRKQQFLSGVPVCRKAL